MSFESWHPRVHNWPQYKTFFVKDILLTPKVAYTVRKNISHWDFTFLSSLFLLAINSELQLISYKRSVHSFNGDYLSIPKGTGSLGYLFNEIPGKFTQKLQNPNISGEGRCEIQRHFASEVIKYGFSTHYLTIYVKY